MRRRICTTIVFLIFLLIPVTVSGAVNGMVIIVPSCGGDGILEGKVRLYHVAEPVEGGYTLTDGLANWFVRDQEAISVDFAKWIINRKKEAGITKTVNLQGAVFRGLKPGIYLAEQKEAAQGYYPFNPFLLTVGQEGETVYAYPKVTLEVPKTGDSIMPLLYFCSMILSSAGILVCICFNGKRT